MPSNPPSGIPQIYPRLAYRDPTEAIAWLSRAFGLREQEGARLCAENGEISLTETELGAGLVMIGAEKCPLGPNRLISSGHWSWLLVRGHESPLISPIL